MSIAALQCLLRDHYRELVQLLWLLQNIKMKIPLLSLCVNALSIICDCPCEKSEAQKPVGLAKGVATTFEVRAMPVGPPA